MKELTREQFSKLLKHERVRSKLVRDLRFVPEEIDDWPDYEMLAISNRSESEGVLLVQLDSFYIMSYQLMKRIVDKQTGRSKPITCDFCYTWQRGNNAGSITFAANGGHSFSFLCCADLKCSRHVRNGTAEAVLSRVQLREDLTTEQRVARLKDKLHKIITIVGKEPIAETDSVV